MSDCPCPVGPGREITDPGRHTTWHAETVAQGVPYGPCGIAETQAARGRASTVSRPVERPDAAPQARRSTIRYHRR